MRNRNAERFALVRFSERHFQSKVSKASGCAANFSRAVAFHDEALLDIRGQKQILLELSHDSLSSERFLRMRFGRLIIHCSISCRSQYDLPLVVAGSALRTYGLGNPACVMSS